MEIYGGRYSSRYTFFSEILQNRRWRDENSQKFLWIFVSSVVEKKYFRVRFVTRRRFDTKKYYFPSLHRNESKSKIGEGRHCDDLHIMTENTYTRVLRRMRRKSIDSTFPPLQRFEVKPKHEKYFYFCIIVASKYFWKRCILAKIKK